MIGVFEIYLGTTGSKMSIFFVCSIVNPGPIHTEIILSRKKLFSIVIIL